MTLAPIYAKRWVTHHAPTVRPHISLVPEVCCLAQYRSVARSVGHVSFYHLTRTVFQWRNTNMLPKDVTCPDSNADMLAKEGLRKTWQTGVQQRHTRHILMLRTPPPILARHTANL